MQNASPIIGGCRVLWFLVLGSIRTMCVLQNYTPADERPIAGDKEVIENHKIENDFRI